MRVSVPVPESKARLTTNIKTSTREMLTDYVELLSAEAHTRIDTSDVLDNMLDQFMRGDREFMAKRKTLEDKRARAADQAEAETDQATVDDDGLNGAVRANGESLGAASVQSA